MKRLIIPFVLLLALAGGAYAYVNNHQNVAPLTGFAASQSLVNRRPIGVTIDNFSPDALPQSGLANADLVYETLAEGGITRYMAVYQSQDAAMIGPVRSTRLYFNHWAAGLGLIFGHDGGNVDSLQELPTLTDVYSEDNDKIHGPFWRTSSRAVPHNEYTSTTLLRDYAAAHGGSTTGNLVTLPHKDDAPLVQRPSHFTLNIQFSYSTYNVSWQYNAQANDYLRSMGGAPDVDAQTGKQLTAKNVVVMFTDETPAYDPFTPGAIHMRTEGTGQATVYEDGTAIAGTWSKPSVTSPLTWLDSHGNPIKLDRGNTWIEVVPKGNSVTTS